MNPKRRKLEGKSTEKEEEPAANDASINESVNTLEGSFPDGSDQEEEEEEGSEDYDDDDDDEDEEGDSEEEEGGEQDVKKTRTLFEMSTFKRPGEPTKEIEKITFQNPEEVILKNDEEEGAGDEVKAPLPRIKLFKSAKNQTKRLIVVLEKANLEIVKAGKDFALINCEDHINLVRKYKKDPAFCRPDITHQCLLMLFDSPLNRAGLLQVYIHTMNNVLIEINPQTRFPRTYKRFANLMVQLLYKMSIKSGQGPEKLLRVIKNPITSHLPVGCRKIGTSFKADRILKPSELITDPESEVPVCIVIGAMAHGEAAVDYTEEVVSISNYPLSGALACTKVVSAFEEAWGVH